MATALPHQPCRLACCGCRRVWDEHRATRNTGHSTQHSSLLRFVADMARISRTFPRMRAQNGTPATTIFVSKLRRHPPLTYSHAAKHGLPHYHRSTHYTLPAAHLCGPGQTARTAHTYQAARTRPARGAPAIHVPPASLRERRPFWRTVGTGRTALFLLVYGLAGHSLNLYLHTPVHNDCCPIRT